LVEVLCDTSFLIHLATTKIKNISNLASEIGTIQFVIPSIVFDELHLLSKDHKKKSKILHTLEFIKKLKRIPLSGTFVDDELIKFVKNNGGIIATMDSELKKRVKEHGGSIISISNDKIVLESSNV